MCPQTLQKTGSPVGTRAVQPYDSSGGDSPAVSPYPLPRAVPPVHPCPSHPAVKSVWTFLITPLEAAGPDSRVCLGQVFIVHSGVRNAECYNLGQRVVGNWTGSLVFGSCASLALCLQSSAWLSSSFASPGSIGLLSSSSSLRVPGPDLGGTVSFG